MYKKGYNGIVESLSIYKDGKVLEDGVPYVELEF